MHNHDDKYLSRSGFEPGTPRLQAPVDTNEPSGPGFRSLLSACCFLGTDVSRCSCTVDYKPLLCLITVNRLLFFTHLNPRLK